MRFVLKIEFTDDAAKFNIKTILAGSSTLSKDSRAGLANLSKRLHPWASRLTSFDGIHFEREFMKGQKDYSLANKRGTRGVFYYFYLIPGLYEISEGVHGRYFARVDQDLEMRKLTKSEMIRCLQNAG